MNCKEGELRGTSYSQITANGNPSEGLKRPTFEPPPNLRTELLEEGTFKYREMDIDPGKETAPGRESTPWLLGKCIPQVLQAPKYVISLPWIKEQ
jgi:hypothetical protein